jgi:hypothetical protein
MERIEITRPIVSIYHMQVCAAADEKVLAACNHNLLRWVASYPVLWEHFATNDRRRG